MVIHLAPEYEYLQGRKKAVGIMYMDGNEFLSRGGKYTESQQVIKVGIMKE